MPIFFVVSEIQGSKLQKLSKKYKFFRIFGPPCRNPLADLKNFASKRAPAYPLSIGLHLMTLTQKQKVAVLFTEVSTLNPKKMFNPQPQGPPWADHPRTTSFPSLVFALPWAKISRRSHHLALRYPQPYKQTKTNRQTNKQKSKLNVTPNATLYGEIINKTYSMIGLIKYNFIQMDTDTITFCLSYKVFVRPRVEYAHSAVCMVST